MPQGATESSDTVNVPTWAIWLTGAVFTMLIAVNIGLIYILSTKRRRPVSGVVVKLDDCESTEPNKVLLGIRAGVRGAIGYAYVD